MEKSVTQVPDTNSYPQPISVGDRFLINACNVDSKAIFNATSDHKTEIVIHNQVKGHLKFMAKIE